MKEFPEIVKNNPKYKIGEEVKILYKPNREDESLISNCWLGGYSHRVGGTFKVRSNFYPETLSYKNLILLDDGWWVSLACIEDINKLKKKYLNHKYSKWKKVNWNY